MDNEEQIPTGHWPAERTESRDSLIGTTLDGRFYVEEVLGSGGMSVVYKAKQLSVNREVAIKMLKMQVHERPGYRQRFEREIASLCALQHPNIVTVYDSGIGPYDQPYVVMDYLRGRSLEELLRDDGPLDIDRFARIAVQICGALDHAHKKGIIHRDLKPGNIVLLDEEMDFVKVVDFGLAQIGQDATRLTHTGEVWGSPPYMSPEQSKSERCDQRSDIYSCGAMMYQMLTGRHPFYGAVTIFEFISKHVTAPVPPLSQANERIAVPWAVEAVILTALEKEPDKRYQSAKQMQDAIVEACSGQLARESKEVLYFLTQQGRAKSPSDGWVVSDLESGPRTPAANYFERALDPMAGETFGEWHPERTPAKSLLPEASNAPAARAFSPDAPGANTPAANAPAANAPAARGPVAKVPAASASAPAVVPRGSGGMRPAPQLSGGSQFRDDFIAQPRSHLVPILIALLCVVTIGGGYFIFSLMSEHRSNHEVKTTTSPQPADRQVEPAKSINQSSAHVDTRSPADTAKTRDSAQDNVQQSREKADSAHEQQATSTPPAAPVRKTRPRAVIQTPAVTSRSSAVPARKSRAAIAKPTTPAPSKPKADPWSALDQMRSGGK